MRTWILAALLTVSSGVYAREDTYLQQYRARVAAYNQDVKAAGYAVAMQQLKEKSAKADFLPSLSGGAGFQYTGNPRELSVALPSPEVPVGFQGKPTAYDATLTLMQPLYAGGAIKAGYDKAKKENEMSRHEKRRVMNDVLYDADVYYWNRVACRELVGVAESFKASVEGLVTVVRHRVQEGYTDRNDLLMAEVKLNEADYRLVQARNEAEVARLAMNSFSGVPFEQTLPTDSLVVPLREAESYAGTVETAMSFRPELKIAGNRVDIQRNMAKMDNARYLPRLSVGIDGSYGSPGYDFKPDADPNYAIYAKLSIPIFEWGKRKNTRKAGQYGVDMAIENQSKVADAVRLEIESAFYTYSQAVRKVVLTENSLAKAAESEERAMDKYKEGRVSIVEVINAQLYHQEARVNYIQSKLHAQMARSGLEHAIGRIGLE